MVILFKNLVDFFSFQLCPEPGDNYFQIRWPMWFPPHNVLLGLFMGPLKAANSIVFRPQGSLLFFKLILRCIGLSASRVFHFKWRKTSFLMVLKTRGLLCLGCVDTCALSCTVSELVLDGRKEMKSCWMLTILFLEII